jgi:pyridoxine 5-phosphate synthase
VSIALDTRPHACCLVPEKRSERTTEGGLEVIGGLDHLKIVAAELGKAGVRVSLFIEPSPEAVRAARAIGAPVVEFHTGAWCDALAHHQVERARHEFARIKAAAALASSQGLECHAGHGLDFATAKIVAGLPEITELNIGHFLIGEAVFLGLQPAIAKMRAAMDEGRAAVAGSRTQA